MRDDELREILTQGIDAIPEPEGSPTGRLDAVRGRLERRRRRRRRLVVTSAAAALVLVLGAVVGAVLLGADDLTQELRVTDGRDQQQEPTTEEQEAGTGDDPESSEAGSQALRELSDLPEPVTELPAPPLSERWKSSVAWTGEELIVWGGSFESFNMGLDGEDEAFIDGAAYSPATGEWRPIPAAPLAKEEPVSMAASASAWTPSGLVVASGRQAALWQPEDEQWIEIDAADGDLIDLTAIAEGVASLRAWQRLDLETGSWVDLPEAPYDFDRWASTWTGDELIVVGGPGHPWAQARAMAYDPVGDEWRTLADPPSELTSEALGAAWDGERVVVVNYDMGAVAYDPAADEWAELPPVPARFGESGTNVVASGGRVVAFMGTAAAILGEGDQWVPVPYAAGGAATGVPRPAAGAVGLGGSAVPPVVFVAGIESSEVEGDRGPAVVALDLVQLAEGPAVQVGVAQFVLPEGFAWRELSLRGQDEIIGGPVARIEGRAGMCEVSSTYFGMLTMGPDHNIEGPTEVTIESVDGRQTDWQRDAAGETLQAAGTTSDLVRISCDESADAEALARGTVLPDHGP